MEKRTVMILSSIAAVILLISCGFFLYGYFSQREQPRETPASDFTVFDAQGEPVQLSAYIGKPIVLNFWASWCGPCRSEMPEFDGKSRELEGEVVFLMVNMTCTGTETMETAKAYVEESGYTFPVLYDLEGQAQMTYSVTSFPTTYFIDKDGNLVGKAVGAIDGKTLEKGIDLIYHP